VAKEPAEWNQFIGLVIRNHRTATLTRGLREMAAALDIAPAHLSDLEKGHRNPSEELLCRIAKAYGLDECILRAGWNKPDAVVTEVATKNPTAAAKVPALLRIAKNFTADEWDALIKEAERLAAAKKRKPGWGR